MQFSAATCYLVSFVTTLVVVTTCLSQSPSGPLDGIARRKEYLHDPFHYKPPTGCLGVGAIKHYKDIGLGLVKRDYLYSPETHAVALDSRQPDFQLPCGVLHGSGQTLPFLIISTVPVSLIWSFGNAILTNQVVRLMRVNPMGADVVMGVARVRTYSIESSLTPIAGALYYIQLGGPDQRTDEMVFSTRN